MRAAESVQADGQMADGQRADGPGFSSQAVIASMRRHGIRFTAGNYAVWQSYLSGSSPILKRAIEIVLSNGGSIDQQALHRLYTRHFCPSEGALGLWQSAQRSLDHLAQTRALLAASAPNDEVVAKLGEVAAQIGEVSSAAQTLVARIAQSEERIALLESYLNDATRDASTDSLTGLSNRRAFDAALRNMAGDAMNTGADLSFILVDVDHFKSVNDTWGHAIGDEVLRHVATILTRTVRGGDLVARYGGEEFAVILGQTGRRGAHSVAENLREAVDANPFTVRTGQGTDPDEIHLHITVSAGFSCYTAGEAISEWIGRADEALYRAKRAGRNRIMFGAASGSHPSGIFRPKGKPHVKVEGIDREANAAASLPPPPEPQAKCAAE